MTKDKKCPECGGTGENQTDGCNCGAPDIGVGIQHEPGCGIERCPKCRGTGSMLIKKHTPGPWQWVKYGPTYSLLGKDTIVIEDYYGADYCPNARLIAASPNMLAALKEALTALEDVVDMAYTPLIPCIRIRVEAAIERVEAAIKKTEGR